MAGSAYRDVGSSVDNLTETTPERNSVNPKRDLDSNCLHNKRNSSCFRLLELTILSAIVVIMIGVYAIPTVFFISPPNILETNFTMEGLTSQGECSLCYTGQICRDELVAAQMACSSEIGSCDLMISATNQELVEQYLAAGLGIGLPTLNPSPDCDVAMRTFLCLHSFGACDGNLSLLATREACSEVRDRVCAREWQKVEDFLSSGGGRLPICEDLPNGTAEAHCSLEVGSYLKPNRTITPATCNESNMCGSLLTETELNCSSLFYFDASEGICRPMCGWSLHERDILKVLSPIALSLALGLSTLTFLSGLTFQRHQIFKFPTVYIFLVNIDIFIAVVSTAIDGIGGSALQCESEDYINNLLSSSSIYCTFLGALRTYCFVQINYWMVFYSASIAAIFYFPFRYREAKLNKNFKYILILTVSLGIILPMVSLVYFLDGFYSSNIVDTTCTPRNPVIHYVVFTLHISFLSFMLTCLLIINVWNFLKQAVILKKPLANTKKTEILLSVILIIQVITIILSLSIDIFLVSLTPEQYLIDLLPYFACESVGTDAGQDCQSILRTIQRPRLFNLAVARCSFVGILPVVLFFSTIDFKFYYRSIKGLCKKNRTKVTSNNSN